eukprot:jgi/Astpho2/2823/Aster-x0131
MAVLSFIPWINWTAWIFAALDDEAQAAKFYTLAALYSLPAVRSALELRLDGFTIFSIVACAIHVQIERIANEEVSGLQVPGISSIAKSTKRAAKQITEESRSYADAIGETRKRQKIELDQQKRAAADDDTKNLIKRSLDSFDVLLSKRKDKDLQ